MMIAALMAGHDPDARAIFDGMYAYFREHPTATHDHLMSWNQNKSCVDAEGNDSASDGDLDIAYALLLADKQWGSCGAIDYAAEAAAVLADIEDGELDTSGRYVLLGDWVDPRDPEYYPSTRSSDFMPDHLRASPRRRRSGVDGRARPDLPDRRRSADDLQPEHRTAARLHRRSARHARARRPRLPRRRHDGAYDYNACRDPWRIATDYRRLRRDARQDGGRSHHDLGSERDRRRSERRSRAAISSTARQRRTPTISRWRSSRRSASARWSTPPIRPG